MSRDKEFSTAMNPDRAKAARELLSFYMEAGVDLPVGETPNDFLSAPSITSAVAGQSSTSERADPPRSPPSATLPRKGGGSIESSGRGNRASSESSNHAAPLSPDAAVMAAREAARSATSLEELRGILERFDGCALKATATQLVFADGNPKARVMFVGEAPGRDEDIEGLPFVGRSGKLLDRMLAAIGLDRTQVYIANIVPWRPPGNRTPTPQEAAICLPFLLRQIALCDPDVLVCMGGPSAQTLLAIKEGILKTRGRWFIFNTGAREIRAMPTLHPAYLLRSPIAKRLAWRDFLAIKKALSA
jgi:uracil-DNA glycosylase family 4